MTSTRKLILHLTTEGALLLRLGIVNSRGGGTSLTVMILSLDAGDGGRSVGLYVRVLVVGNGGEELGLREGRSVSAERSRRGENARPVGQMGQWLIDKVKKSD